jgi:chromosome segregation ATPase
MNTKQRKENVKITMKSDLSKTVSATAVVPIIPSIKSTSNSRISNDSLVATNLNLNNKLVEQSHELIALSCAYEDKKKKMNELEKKYKDNCIVTNEISLSNKYNKETIDSLILQLETSNKQLEECNNQKKRLQNNYDTKSKEIRSFKEKNEELQNENTKLINKIESSNRISGSLTRNINIKENLKNTKNELDICRNELRKYKEGYEESNEKIIIMEGALEYKSNEIGVAGHADLLTTISQIRGENSALKADINEKRNKLHEVQENNNVLLSQQETLMRQITSTHERLTKSQIDLSKLQSSDIGGKLQEAVKERNLLLEYIQTDLEKNGNVCKRLSLLEIDYQRVNEELKLLKENEKKSGSLLEKEISKVSSLTVELTNLRSRLIEVSKFNDLVQSEQTTLSSQLNRKGLEADELSKMQMALLLQVYIFIYLLFLLLLLLLKLIY